MTTYLRLTASSTFSFIIGPSLGGFLYKHFDKKAPALLASLLFIFNFLLAATFLPHEKIRHTSLDMKQDLENTISKPSRSKVKTLISNVKSCFSSKQLASVVLSILLYCWISGATSYASMTSYYEQMFGIEPHQRGYIRSYTSVLSLLFQTFFVRTTLRKLGNEYNAACIASFAMTFATLLELSASFNLFLTIICPVVAVANALLRLSLRSLVTLVAPKQSLGSVLAALDVLQNVAAVSVPFYRTVLFQILAKMENDKAGMGMKGDNTSMIGDPNPKMWLKSSLIHWILASLILSALLMKHSRNATGQKIKQV